MSNLPRPHTRYKLVLTFNIPDAWLPELADEVQHRIAQGLGNARIQFALADAALSAPIHIPFIHLPPARELEATGQPPHRIYSITLGAAGRDKILAATGEGWTRQGYARSAVRYYLDLPLDARPRNCVGSDVRTESAPEGE